MLRLRGPGGETRFGVIDYKTNRVGPPGSAISLDDFHPDRLPATMVHHQYPLQALLYSVALHRYLRWRLPGYEPDRHLGPVGYLFLRGMIGPDRSTAHGQPYGVFTWTLPSGLVADLSDLLHGLEVADMITIPRPGAVDALAPFVDAGVLGTVEIEVATTLVRASCLTESVVALAVALAVRAPLWGHVCVDLASVAVGSVVVDVDDLTGAAELSWPDPVAWVAAVAASPVARWGRAHRGPPPRPWCSKARSISIATGGTSSRSRPISGTGRAAAARRRVAPRASPTGSWPPCSTGSSPCRRAWDPTPSARRSRPRWREG